MGAAKIFLKMFVRGVWPPSLLNMAVSAPVSYDTMRVRDSELMVEGIFRNEETQRRIERNTRKNTRMDKRKGSVQRLERVFSIHFNSLHRPRR